MVLKCDIWRKSGGNPEMESVSNENIRNIMGVEQGILDE